MSRGKEIERDVETTQPRLFVCKPCNGAGQVEKEDHEYVGMKRYQCAACRGDGFIRDYLNPVRYLRADKAEEILKKEREEAAKKPRVVPEWEKQAIAAGWKAPAVVLAPNKDKTGKPFRDVCKTCNGTTIVYVTGVGDESCPAGCWVKPK